MSGRRSSIIDGRVIISDVSTVFFARLLGYSAFSLENASSSYLASWDPQFDQQRRLGHRLLTTFVVVSSIVIARIFILFTGPVSSKVDSWIHADSLRVVVQP